MASIDDVCDALAAEVVAAINDAGITTPGQVGLGWPSTPSLTQILGQSQWQVSIFPLPGTATNRTSRKPRWFEYSKPAVELVAAISGDQATFSGTSPVPYNIVVLLGDPPQRVVQLQTALGDPLDVVAAKCADAINAAALAGVSASALDVVLTVDGAPFRLNIGGSGSIAREVARRGQRVQISVWAPAPDGSGESPIDGNRRALMAAITARIGVGTRPFVLCADGTKARVCFSNDRHNDDQQSSYSVYRGDVIVDCEYAVLEVVPATQVEAVIASGDVSGVAG